MRKDNYIHLFMSIIFPNKLSKGDLIQIIAPARSIAPQYIEHATSIITSMGFEVSLGKNLFGSSDQFSGSDAQRLEDLNTAIQNPRCKAILCARGGYGSVRIIDKIDLATFKKNPKWIVGYSDMTAIINHIYTQIGIAAIHGSMPINFSTNTEESLDSWFRILTGNEVEYEFPAHHLNRAGIAEGRMIGGNLSMLYSLLGSRTQLDTAGAILFLEDLDEYLYHIDRMMMALDRAGMLSNLAGLIVGGMTDMNDNKVPFGKTAEEIIKDRVSQYSFPVCFGFPAGHIDDNRAWVHGKKIRLTVLNDQPSRAIPLKE